MDSNQQSPIGDNRSPATGFDAGRQASQQTMTESSHSMEGGSDLTLPTRHCKKFGWIQKKHAFLAIVFLSVIALVALGAYYVTYTMGKTSVAQSTASAKSVNSNVAQANDRFGLAAFNNLVQQSPKDNIFISPASLSLALSMVYNGAEGSTQSAMQQVLGYQGLSLATINSSNHALISGLKNPDPKVSLAIANSAWLKQGYHVNGGFMNTVKNDYQAKATYLSFSSPSAPATINSWVSTATNGKIPSIINQIPKNELLYLINAIYYKGQWHTVFDPSATQTLPFQTGNGNQVSMPLMSSTSSYNYYADDTLQAIELPYGQNQRFSMDVYLPSDMTSFLKSLDYDRLRNIDSLFTRQQGTILLPKFSLDYSKNLNDTLKALGMGVALDPYGAANFDGIGKGIYITDVEHKTYLNVDEQGTTAAAATSVGTGGNLDIVSSGFDMEVNKPFVFTIQDNSTKELLFIGAIQDPSL